MALGKGLSSLIPNRGSGNLEDMLDKMEQMDLEEDEQIVPIAGARNSAQVSKDRAVPVTEEGEDVVSVRQEKEVQEEKTDDVPEEEVVEVEADEDDELEVPEEEVIEEESDVSEEDSQEAPSEVKETAPEEAPIVPDNDDSSADEDDTFVSSMGESNIHIWDKHEERVEHVAIGDISINPLQPRRDFDPQELEDLKESIERHGILQPLVVRRMEENTFELIAGERRLRAAKMLKWEKIPCVVRRDVGTDQSRLVYALIENIQRENLNPIEEALAYKQLNEDYGLSHEEIGQRVGKSRVGITNIMRILQLPAEIQRGMIEGKITMGHAKAILMIPDEEKQVRFYRHLLDEGLTVRKAEIRARRIQRTMNLDDPMRKKRRGRHPLALKYSPVLEERYGYSASVKFDQEKSQYHVVFKASSDSEIEELLGRLLGQEELPGDDVDRDVIDD